MNKKAFLMLPLLFGILMASCSTSDSGNPSTSQDPAISNSEGILYEVDFRNYDDTLLAHTRVRSGEDAIYEGTEPTRRSDSEDSYYKFAGWDKPLSNITASTTFKAQFTKEYYTLHHVDFYNYDGSLLYSSNVKHGQSAIFEGNMPTRPDDDFGTNYVFTGWNKSTANIVEDTAFTATFSPKSNLCTVTFKNYDDSLLDVEYVEYGGTATYNGETPTKPASEGVSYKFIGWDQPLTNINESVTVKPIFSNASQECVVTFQNYDGSVLYVCEVEVGEDAYYYGETPTKESDGQYDYSFSGWDKDFTNIHSNLLVTAKYEKVERDFSSSLGFALQSDDSYQVVSNYDSSAKTILIPRRYNNKRVKSVGNNVFAYNNNLESVKFENGGVSTINYRAFYGCNNLKSVTFPNTLQTIDDNAFSNTALTSISIPANVNSINGRAFTNCSKLKSLEISPNNPYLTNDGGLVMNKNKTTVKAYIYLYGNGNTEVEIPEGVTSIDNEVFRTDYGYYSGDNKNVTKITFPSTLESIGSGSFYGLNNLKSIVFNDSPVSISYDCFNSCYDLDSIDLGNAIRRIENNCFYDVKIKELHIPDSLTYLPIGNNNFYSSTLETITIDEGNTSFSLFDGVLYDSNRSNFVITPRAKTGTLTVPKEYTSENLSYFLSQFNNISQVTIEDGNSVYSSDDDAIYNTNKTKLYFVRNKNIASFTVPDSVVRIASSAFDSLDSLVSVTLPNTIVEIGSNAFSNCSSLQSVNIPTSLTTIQSGTFSSCYTLQSIEIPGNIASIQSNAFQSCSMLKNVTLSSGLKRIESSVFNACNALTSITLPDTLTYIGWGAFYNCGLTSIVIPDSVSQIEESAFCNCQYLKTIKLSSSLTTIPNYFASSDNALNSVEIPNSVTRIGYSAFSNTSLKKIVIPNSVTSIDSCAFQYCYQLVSAEVNANITNLPSNAFNYCNSLVDVILPSTLTSIDSGAFEGCDNLSHVYYKGTSSTWNSISCWDVKLNNIKYTKIYYYSETKNADGKHWRYVDNVPTIWTVDDE